MSYYLKQGTPYKFFGGSVIRRVLEYRGLRPTKCYCSGNTYKWRIEMCIGGQTSLQLKKKIVKLARARQAFADSVVVHVGSNDVLKNRTSRQTLDRIGEIVRLFKTKSRVHLCTIGPIAGREELVARVNQGIRARCRQGSAILIDMAAALGPEDLMDNVHHNSHGLQKMENLLRQHNL